MEHRAIILVIFGQLFLINTVLAYEKLEPTDVNNYTIENIFFMYYYGPTVYDFVHVPYKNGLSIPEYTTFNTSFETVLYFPGWGEYPYEHIESVDTMASAYIERGYTNLIVMDYSILLKADLTVEYISAVGNITEISKCVAYFLKHFSPEYQELSYIHLVGHSLGGQIMAKTAKIYGKGELYWLTALDAAGPFFGFPLKFAEHLEKNDAKFVDAIHTDAGFYGYKKPCGHIDFYPNRGTRIQPGCESSNNTFCSHHMSWRLYAASLTNPDIFPAKRQNSWYCIFKGFLSIFHDFNTACNSTDISLMGVAVNKNATEGTYHLSTSGTFPYGRGSDGIQ